MAENKGVESQAILYCIVSWAGLQRGGVVHVCLFLVSQGTRAPGEEYNLADAPGCKLLPQTERKSAAQSTALSFFVKDTFFIWILLL